MHTGGVIFLAIAAILIGIWLEQWIVKLVRSRKQRQSVVPISARGPRATSAEMATSSKTPSAFPPLKPFRSDDSFDRVKDRLRDGKSSGRSLDGLITTIAAEFGDRVTMSKILEAAVQAGYPPKDVAAFMASRKYGINDIAATVSGEGISVPELGDILMPLTQGTTLERAEEIFKAVKLAYDIDDDDDDLLQLPARLGCTPEETAEIIHSQTDLSLGAVLRMLKLGTSPDVAARIAEKTGIDLSDEEEYSDLRDEDDITFDDAAAILKACGKDAASIISAEGASYDLSDELDSVFVTLSKAGFTKAEIMEGISESNIIDDNSSATIVDTALNNKTPMKDIVSFLEKEGFDADSLDEEMRDLDFEVSRRVDILYAFLHPEKLSTDEVPVAI